MHVRWVSVRWSILYTDRIHLHLWILPLCYRHNEKQVDRNKSPSDIDGGSFFFTFLMTIKTGMFSDDTSVIGFSIPASFTDLLIRWISVPTWRRGKKHTVQPRKHRVHTGSNPQRFCVKENTNILLLLLHGTNNGNNVVSFHMIMFLFAMQAHYSTASILAYITQSNKVIQKTEQVHVRLATQCQTNVYSWFYS